MNPAPPQRIEAHTAVLGDGMQVRRALPSAQRRLVGAWCFLDHFGPANVASGRGLRVGPHPHIGLQTVTWLIEGEILHRDSLGSVQAIRPGQLNLMTSGRGIAHSEESPEARPAALHGVQLWIALPETARNAAPAFDHHASLPVIEHEGARITVLVGELLGALSPAQVHTPLLGLDIQLSAGAATRLPLPTNFEYGLVVTQGEARVGGDVIAPGTLLYFGAGTASLNLSSAAGARLCLVGGAPLDEPVLMWWNFVGREKRELVEACRDWNAQAPRFGQVSGYDGPALVAPLPPWASG